MKKFLMLIIPAFMLLSLAARADIVLDSLWQKDYDTVDINDVKISHDGRYIALAQQHLHWWSLDTAIVPPLLIDAYSGEIIRALTGGHNARYITAVCFSPDDSILATGDDPFDSLRTVCIWNYRTGQLIRRLLRQDTIIRNNTSTILSLEFTSDGRYLVCYLISHNKYFDPESGKMKNHEPIFVLIDTQSWQIARISGIHPHSHELFALSPSRSYAYSDGEVLKDHSQLSKVFIRNLMNDSLIKEFTHTGPSFNKAFSPDSLILAEILSDTIRLYDLSTLTILKDIPLEGIGSPTNLKFTRDSRYLALSLIDGPDHNHLKIIDINTGQVAAFDDFSGYLDIDHSGRKIAFGIGPRLGLDSIIYTPSAIQDNTQSGKIDVVYPNPTDGNINIRINEEPAGPVQVEIFDVNGGRVDCAGAANVISEAGKGSVLRYDAGSLPVGVYYINIRGLNQPKAYKLIISR